MEQWIGAVAVVTGASAGIGESIAIELVKKGLKVVGLARRIDRLNKLKEDLKNESGEFHPIKCDMTIEEDILAAFQWTRNNLSGVNLLVNNAGTLRNTSLTEGKTSDWKTVIDLNLLGLCIATREAVKIMTEKNIAGLIIHINSVAGHYPISSMASQINVYGATKYGVTNLAETLRLELAAKKSNIRVTSLSPGYVKTEILEAAGFGTMKGTDETFKDAPTLEPLDISNAILYLMSTPPSVNVTELTIRPTRETF
ncbi:farnesol dehydrogenase-like isoform X3 [Chrysoperla carnea]|uniref:farnesol dehydrogenase-like isoform X3 n=1 Tax=Chrysoperla carnea TaxID=189513 RepID=UPI001D07A574|nr:farnesol dehydrogenase-like isoform X3 [Chrysoperla carnea]